jgi:hypothetical protein
MQLPHYPDHRNLLLEDKPSLDALFRELQPRMSELTFAGLYLFRTAHTYRMCRLDDSVIILGKGYDGSPYSLPPLSGNRVESARRLLASGWELYGDDEQLAATLAGSGTVTSVEDRDSFDYVYLRNDLAELPGNRHHKKKNRISYFTNRQEFIVEEYGDRHRDGCLALLDDWTRVHTSMANSSLAQEVQATAEALEISRHLGLEGVVVLVAGEVRAFALGERLNATTSVCHFQKANPFLDGLYQLVDREFNRRLFTDCEYVNREQDLGETNLRKSKLSYHPVELVRKYRIRSTT